MRSPRRAVWFEQKGNTAAGMGERVALTDVIIHSGQKTVSRYIRLVVMHHVALYSRKQKCPVGVHAFCLRVTRRVRRRPFPTFLERFARGIRSAKDWSFNPFDEPLSSPVFSFLSFFPSDARRDEGNVYDRNFSTSAVRVQEGLRVIFFLERLGEPLGSPA